MRTSAIIIAILAFIFSSSAGNYSNEGCRSRRKVEYTGPRSSINTAYTIPELKWSSQDGVTFQSSFPSPTAWLNRQIMLTIDSAESAYAIYVNGQYSGYCQSNSSPMTFNITRYSVTGKNIIELKLDKEAPTSSLFSSMTKGIGHSGIICQPTIRISNILCRTTLNESGDGILNVGIIVKCDALGEKAARYDYAISDNGEILEKGISSLELDMKREDTVHFACRIPREKLWSPSSANMLVLTIESRIENRLSERISLQIGAREITVVKGKVYVNGSEQAIVAKEVSSIEEIITAEEQNSCSTVILTADGEIEPLLAKCDSEGVMAIIRCSVDTSSYDKSNDKKHNPAYVRAFVPSISERLMATYECYRTHPCVIGYIIGSGKHAGYGIYEAYSMLSNKEKDVAIMYDGLRGPWAVRSISSVKKE